jgi:hypothetical protein
MASRLTAVAFIVSVLVVGTVYLLWDGSFTSPLQTHKTDPSSGCTREARVCPDGTIVTRTGPSCAFAECTNDRITDLTPSTTQAHTPDRATTTLAQEENIVTCTRDAKQCPDGSYVGRSGPNCEFVCPSEPVHETVIVNGVVTVGPSCPTMRIPPDNSCEDKPYEGTILLTNTATGQSHVAQTDAQGAFTLTIMRGVYDVSRPPGESPFPACSGKIEISAAGGPIPIFCDSGIR